MDLGLNSFYIAGHTETRVYLANYTAPSIILVVDEKADDSVFLNLAFQKDISLSGSYSSYIDSPTIFIFDGLTPQVIKGDLTSNRLSLPTSTPLSFSSSCAVALDSNTSVARRFDRKLGRNILIKSTISSKTVMRYPGILTKQIDGLFCTDGVLNYDRKTQNLVYTYYYRNEYILLDKELNIIKTGHTIDTTSTAHIKVAKINSDKSVTLAAPPEFINLRSSLSGDWLFIQSPVKAINEQKDEFNNNSVVDIYTASDDKYRFSIYIPDLNNKKITGFEVHGNNLYVIQDKYLTIFQLNLPEMK